ncbi:MAG: methyltransferase domain-containing protein [Pyrinomonadaceae bacterium]|nr:methyltransferase domain-containing protein [Pyrinomonadaceae bacterium]
MRIELVHRVEFIKRMCKDKKVLHLGCTNFPYTENSIKDGSLLHFQLMQICKELYGIDADERGIEELRHHGVKNLYKGDLEKLEESSLNEKFEVIVAGEVIEHLSNPGLFLNGIKRFMNSETILIITTINAYSGLRFAIYALRGKGGENEPVHPDHVAYYSYRTLNLIVKRAGLKVENFYFYDIGPEHRIYNPWYYNFVNDVAVKISRQLADGVIAVCKIA